MKTNLETILQYRQLAKITPEFKPTYLAAKEAYLRKFRIVKAWIKVKWFSKQMFGVTCTNSDGDCDGVSESYAFRFLFLECYLGSAFQRSRTAPSDTPYGISHGLNWKLKDLLSLDNWRFNSMFIEK